MEKYLDQNIKDIIARYPGVGDVLNEHKIACAACTAGTCRLRDIVEIHNLPGAVEERLMGKIALAISPGGGLKLPVSRRKSEPAAGEIKYSPPLKRLVDEHALIKRLLALIPRLVAGVDFGTEEGAELAGSILAFIRAYADKYHHAKEEDILFRRFDGNLDVIKAMLQDHVTGRGHVKDAAAAMSGKNGAAVATCLMAYHGLLTEHIKKEDEILYPWMDRNLSTTQVGELFSEFMEADKKIGAETVSRQQKFVEEAERKYGD